MNIGIDIGGTRIAAALIGADGSIHNRLRRDTPASPDDIVREVTALILALQAHNPSGIVGVAAAGFISAERGTVLHAPNIAWTKEPLRT